MSSPDRGTSRAEAGPPTGEPEVGQICRAARSGWATGSSGPVRGVRHPAPARDRGHRRLPALPQHPRPPGRHGELLHREDLVPRLDPSVFGVAALAWGTVLSSVLALVIAVPVVARDRPVHRPLRAHAGSRRGWATWSTCSPRCRQRHLRPVGPGVPGAAHGRADPFLADHFGWIPIFARPGARPTGRPCSTPASCSR